jgi:hypothetical protein
MFYKGWRPHILKDSYIYVCVRAQKIRTVIWIFISEFILIITWYFIQGFLEFFLVFWLWAWWCKAFLNSTFRGENCKLSFLRWSWCMGMLAAMEFDEIVAKYARLENKLEFLWIGCTILLWFSSWDLKSNQCLFYKGCHMFVRFVKISKT